MFGIIEFSILTFIILWDSYIIIKLEKKNKELEAKLIWKEYNSK